MDVKEAIQKAKAYARDILSDEQYSDLGLEEVIHEDNQWRITLGFSRPWNTPRTTIVGLPTDRPRKRSYRVITVDENTGEPVSIRLRESVGE